MGIGGCFSSQRGCATVLAKRAGQHLTLHPLTASGSLARCGVREDMQVVGQLSQTPPGLRTAQLG